MLPPSELPNQLVLPPVELPNLLTGNLGRMKDRSRVRMRKRKMKRITREK